MRNCIFVVLMSVLLACASTGSRAGPKLPEGARPLAGDEIKLFLTGRTFRFVVYDSSKSLTVTSTWDSERGIVFGEFVWNNQSAKSWQRTWTIEGDKNCTRSEGKAAECQNIYVDGNRFIEVTDGGVIHAISTPVK